MARVILTTTIPAGQSLSGALDMSSGTAIFLHMPAEWTPAVLSFLISKPVLQAADRVFTITVER